VEGHVGDDVRSPCEKIMAFLGQGSAIFGLYISNRNKVPVIQLLKLCSEVNALEIGHTT
jgi:hypothetical protein